MAFVDKLPIDAGELRNIHPGTLPLPSHDLGVIDVVNTTIRTSQYAVSAVGAAGVTTAAVTAGVGVVLVVAAIVWNLIKNHQAVVKAKRRARRTRWQAFYDTGIALINEVYGSTKDFDWSHAHHPDVGFGEYYSLGATFYWWQGGTERRDPSTSAEGFREQVVNSLKGWGLEPTRIMGYDNVALSEELNPQTDFVAKPEKILTTKEILLGIGYTNDDIGQATYEEPFSWLYDFFLIDLPNVKTEQEAKILMDEVDISLKTAGLDSAKFFKAANPSSVPDPTGAQATVAQQPVIIPVSSTTPTVPEIPSPTGAVLLPSTIPVSEEGLKVLVAGMPSWGWFLLAGIGISLLLGGKKKETERRQ